VLCRPTDRVVDASVVAHGGQDVRVGSVPLSVLLDQRFAEAAGMHPGATEVPLAQVIEVLPVDEDNDSRWTGARRGHAPMINPDLPEEDRGAKGSLP
jgi:hypothetical protein